MELTNDFTVPVGVERAWEVLTDVELIAPCLPGAQLQEIDGDEYRGIVKVKVGPITAQYKGAATFKEKDETNRRLVLDAGGRDTRGQGSADAVITVTMAETDGSTHVEVHSDVTIKGKVAQFGRGMIADVSAKLLTQFVECLEGKLEAPSDADEEGDSDEAVEGETVTTSASASGSATRVSATDGSATNGAASSASSSGVRKIEQPEVQPVDLLDTAGAPVAKRIAPIVAIVVVLLLLGRRRSKKRRG